MDKSSVQKVGLMKKNSEGSEGSIYTVNTEVA